MIDMVSCQRYLRECKEYGIAVFLFAYDVRIDNSAFQKTAFF